MGNNIIECFVPPLMATIITEVTYVILTYAKIKKEEKGDPENFTVKLGKVYIVSLIIGAAAFLLIITFFNLKADVDLSTRILITAFFAAAVLWCIGSAFYYTRKKISVRGGKITVTPAFSKSYTVVPDDIKKVDYDEKKLTVYLRKGKFNVYRVYLFYGAFEDWIERYVYS